MGLRSTLGFDASLLRSLPVSVAAGTIVAFPIPPAPGLWPFLKLTVAGVVAGAIYGSVVPDTNPGQSHMMRGGKAGMFVGLPAFLIPLAVWVGSVDVVEYIGPLVIMVLMIGPILVVLGAFPGALGGVLGKHVLAVWD